MVLSKLLQLGAPVKCGFADLLKVLSGKMRRNTVDVMGKMRMWQCRYADNERMPIAYRKDYRIGPPP